MALEVQAARRPRLPADLRGLIHEMAVTNPLWGEERIASELLLKVGIRVSPRTVRRYMPPADGPGLAEAPNGGAPLSATTCTPHSAVISS
jgi:hypothetical protein